MNPSVADKVEADIAALEGGDMKYYIMESALHAAERNAALLARVRTAIMTGLRIRIAKIGEFISEGAEGKQNENQKFFGSHANRYQTALDALQRGEETVLMDNIASGIVIPATVERNTEEVRFSLPIE